MSAAVPGSTAESKAGRRRPCPLHHRPPLRISTRSPRPVSLTTGRHDQPIRDWKMFPLVRYWVIGSPQIFGVCCSGSNPDTGTSYLAPNVRLRTPVLQRHETALRRPTSPPYTGLIRHGARSGCGKCRESSMQAASSRPKHPGRTECPLSAPDRDGGGNERGLCGRRIHRGARASSGGSGLLVSHSQ